METLLIWVGVLAVLSLVASTVSLWKHFTAGSLNDLTSKVRALDLDLNNLFDQVDHWQRREKVRRLRDGREAALVQPPAPPDGAAARQLHKAELRKRVRELARGGSNEPAQ